MMNRDMMNNADPQGVGRAAMWMLDKIQGIEGSHTQVASIGVLFLLLCDRFSVTPQDVFTTVNNMMHTTQGDLPVFRGIKMYMENEL